MQTGLAHVDLEGDVVEAGSVIGGRRGAVVGGIVVRATEGGLGLLVAGQAAAVSVGRGRTGRREAVGVCGGIGDGGAGCSGLGVIDEVFLGSPVVDHVLVLHITGRNAHGDAVHAVSVLIGQGVVGLGTAPAAPGAGHVHGGEGLAAAGHVHGERGRRGQAVAVAVEVGGCIGAGAVILGGRVVIVAGVAVGTPGAAAGHGLEAEGVLDQEGLVSVGEDLDVELPAEVTIGGGLREEHLLIGTGDAVGAAGQNVPSPADGRADVHVAAGAEPDFPGSDVGVDKQGDVGLTRAEVRLLFDSDCHPAVVQDILQSRHGVEQGVDGRRGRSTQRVLIKGRGGVEEQGIRSISNHGGHEVIRGRGVEIHPVSGQTGDHIRGHGLHRERESRHVSSGLETGVLGIRGAKEGHQQTSEGVQLKAHVHAVKRI